MADGFFTADGPKCTHLSVSYYPEYADGFSSSCWRCVESFMELK